MTDKRIFWLVILAAFAFTTYMLGSTIVPFLLCFVLAYMLDPLVSLLERMGLGRTFAVTIICVFAVMLFLALIVFLVPFVISQAIDLARALPTVLNWMVEGVNNFLNTPSSSLEWVMSLFDIDNPADVQKKITAELSASVQSLGKVFFQDTAAILRASANNIAALGNSLSFLALVPFILFYLLRDWQSMIAQMVDILPRSKVSSAKILAFRCDKVLGGFFRGQLLVAVFLGLFYGVGLQITGVPFGFIIGFFSGLLSFIPYVGMLIGFFVAEILALVHFGLWLQPILVATVFIVGQAIESSYLTPKFIGETIQLHPVWVIFGLLAGGSLFGFMGLLFAIPILAILGVLVRFMLEQYQVSEFYQDR